MRTYRGQSPEERRLDRRARLIEAGIQLFGTRGFAATRLRDVCYVSGLTERYVYEQFADLAALFDTVLDVLVAELAEHGAAAMRDAYDRREPTARVGARALLSWTEADPVRARVVFVEALVAHPELQGTRVKVIDGAAAFFEIAATMQRKTELPADALDRRLNGLAMAGATAEVMRAWLDAALDVPAEQAMAQLAAIAIESIAVTSGG